MSSCDAKTLENPAFLLGGRGTTLLENHHARYHDVRHHHARYHYARYYDAAMR